MTADSSSRTPPRLQLSRDLLAALERHALAAYPEECCGVLVGRRSVAGTAEAGRVISVLPVRNVHRGPRTRRYAIAPEELLRAHKRARASGQEVLGYYHSHPDREALPSRTDLATAGAGVSYLILAVQGDRVLDRRCWRLHRDGTRFEPERLDLLNPEDGALRP